MSPKRRTVLSAKDIESSETESRSSAKSSAQPRLSFSLGEMILKKVNSREVREGQAARAAVREEMETVQKDPIQTSEDPSASSSTPPSSTTSPEDVSSMIEDDDDADGEEGDENNPVFEDVDDEAEDEESDADESDADEDADEESEADESDADEESEADDSDDNEDGDEPVEVKPETASPPQSKEKRGRPVKQVIENLAEAAKPPPPAPPPKRGRPPGSKNKNKTSPEEKARNSDAKLRRTLGSLENLSSDKLDKDGKVRTAAVIWPEIPLDENGAPRIDLSMEEIKAVGALDLDSVRLNALRHNWLTAKARGEKVNAFDGPPEDKWEAALTLKGMIGLRVSLTRVLPSSDNLPSIDIVEGVNSDYSDFVTYIRMTHWRGEKEQFIWDLRHNGGRIAKGKIDFDADLRRRREWLGEQNGTTASAPQQQPQYQQPPQPAPFQPQSIFQQPAPQPQKPASFTSIQWEMYKEQQRQAEEQQRQAAWKAQYDAQVKAQAASVPAPSAQPATFQQPAAPFQPAHQGLSEIERHLLERLAKSDEQLTAVLTEIRTSKMFSGAAESSSAAIAEAQRQAAEATARANAMAAGAAEATARANAMAAGTPIVAANLPPSPPAAPPKGVEMAWVGDGNGGFVRVAADDAPAYFKMMHRQQQPPPQPQQQQHQPVGTTVIMPQPGDHQPRSVFEDPVKTLEDAVGTIDRTKSAWDRAQRALGLHHPPSNRGGAPDPEDYDDEDVPDVPTVTPPMVPVQDSSVIVRDGVTYFKNEQGLAKDDIISIAKANPKATMDFLGSVVSIVMDKVAESKDKEMKLQEQRLTMREREMNLMIAARQMGAGNVPQQTVNGGGHVETVQVASPDAPATVQTQTQHQTESPFSDN